MEKQKNQKVKVGTVVSDKMDKTVTVTVESLVLHSRIKKYHKRRTKFKAHDQSNRCSIGDLVEVVESRPLSKTKRWSVRKIIKKAEEIS
ncbi:MAG: 30S ribosomal protein S17 [Deltaproteobacteria bacterium]|nr:30S ribosomal protein S17 [Deltaproteobacteria bacterium]